MKVSLLKSGNEALFDKALATFIDEVAITNSLERSLEKVARQLNLSPDQIRRVAHAYNTGTILNQLKTSEGVFEKAAAPRLVNAELVVKSIFKNAKVVDDDSVSTDYFSPPKLPVKSAQVSETFSVGVAVSRILKQAEYKIKTSPPPPTRQQLKQEKLDKQAAARNTIISKLFTLKDYFRKEGAIDPDEVIENSTLVFGSGVRQLIKYALEGVSNKKFTKYAEVNWDKTPYKEVAEICKNSQQLVEATREVDSFYLKEKKTPSLYSGSVVDQLVKTSCLIDNYLTKQGVVTKPASLKGVAEEIFFSTSQVAGISPTKEDVVATNLEEQYKLNKARVLTVLADLANNHPVISRYSWDQIMDGYNHLSKLAPVAAQQEPIIRQYLAKMLETNGLDQMDLETLTKINTQLSRVSAETMNIVLGRRPDAKNLTTQ